MDEMKLGQRMRLPGGGPPVGEGWGDVLGGMNLRIKFWNTPNMIAFFGEEMAAEHRTRYQKRAQEIVRDHG